MKIKVLTESEESEESAWENFVKQHELGNIHQMPVWGRFQSKVPSRGKYWIVGIFDDNNNIVGGTLLLRYKLPKGYCWLYSPRGPLINYKNPDPELQLLATKIRTIALKEKAVFWRIDPAIPPHSKLKTEFKAFRTVQHGFQPEHTLILDIDKSEEEILKQMKPKGRYNIKVANKKGVKVDRVDTSKPKEFKSAIAAYYKILQETTSRDGFTAHPQSYYEDMITTLAKQKAARFYLASFDGQPIAGIINTYCKDTAIYYFGASSNQQRNLMANYALHWEAIKDARQDGYTKYDLFGIAPPGDKNHPWSGVSQFKRKFGGAYFKFPKAKELPLKKLLYKLYSFKKKC